MKKKEGGTENFLQAGKSVCVIKKFKFHIY